MSKGESLILVILFIFIGVASFCICRSNAKQSELEYELNKMQEYIVTLEGEQLKVDDAQNNLIMAIIKTEAMQGTFDKGE